MQEKRPSINIFCQIFEDPSNHQNFPRQNFALYGKGIYMVYVGTHT